MQSLYEQFSEAPGEMTAKLMCVRRLKGMAQCEECVHYSCRGDEYIENCARCRNRSKFVNKDQPEENNYDSYQINRNANYDAESEQDVIHSNSKVRNRVDNADDVKEQKETKDLTLRDKFAMVALQSQSLNLTCMNPKQVAQICYEVADAMMETR